MLNLRLYTIARIESLLGAPVHKARFIILCMPVFQALGIITYFSLDHEPSIPLLWTLTILGITLITASVAYRMPVLLIAVLVIVGFVGAYIKTVLYDPRSVCVQRRMYAGRLVGNVKAIEHKPHYVQMFICDIDCEKFGKYCARISVRTAIDPLIEVGDRVVFSAVLYPPGPSDSANGFDFARYSYFQGITATGFTVSRVGLHKKAARVKFQDFIEKVRDKSHKRFLLGLSKDCAEILAALLIGKKSGLRAEILTDMRNSGLAHLLAISGLHLSFVSGIAFLFFRYLLAFSEKISLNYDAKKVCAVAAILVGFFYLLVAGMPISASRAFIMVLMAFCGVIIERRHDALASVSAAAFVVLFFSPEAVFSPSFQMSFAAVLALISTGELLTCIQFSAGGIAKYITKTAVSSCIANMATAPYVIYHFHYFSFVGVIANIVAVPMTTFVVMPLGIVYQIIATTSLRIPVGYLLESAVGAVLSVAKHAAGMGWAIKNFGSIPGESVLLMSCGMLVVGCMRGTWAAYGLLIGAFGAMWAVMYRTPDIIMDQEVVVVKDEDSKLYFIALNGSGRKRRYARWAEDNEQKSILRYVNSGKNSRLQCSLGDCIYSDRVLISPNADFLVKHCREVELVIYNGIDRYPAVCAAVQHVTLDDVYNYGVHYVWLRNHSVAVKGSVSQRLWHKNAVGYLRWEGKSSERLRRHIAH